MNNKIISLLALFGYNQGDYAKYMGMSKSSLSNKIKRGSYTAKDLIDLAEMTGNRLAIVDSNNKVIIEFNKNDLSK
ncbi:helix-turn-helix domain-containing protein [Thomasclavelia cocleata]|uniref:helix-turn-helix domain-containing protein n=1 Tax=Thomasclavelia cocleata TaxID=69824 RepID=UPI00249408BD|nr:helix-turn-helix domain-containing protein [Thomasclavelia cocleata]